TPVKCKFHFYGNFSKLTRFDAPVPYRVTLRG
ncbi:hypothetical protein ABIC13_003297, partial [Sphingomonas sp. PvP015]